MLPLFQDFKSILQIRNKIIQSDINGHIKKQGSVSESQNNRKKTQKQKKETTEYKLNIFSIFQEIEKRLEI